jgi:hypothetical protein
MIARRMMLGMVAGLLVVGFAGSSAVMAAKGDKAGPKAQEKAAERVEAMLPVERLEAAIGGLGLSDEQKGKVEDAIKPFKDESAKWKEDHKADLDKVEADLVAARQEKDHQKTKAAMQDLRKLIGTAPQPADAVAKLKDVLTADQLNQVQEKLDEAPAKGKGKKAK